MANQTSNAAKSGPTGRGFIGTMAAMSSYDDESYLDFIEGLRMFALRSMNPSSARALKSEIDAGKIKSENPKIEETRSVADPIPVIGIRNRSCTAHKVKTGQEFWIHMARIARP